MSLHKILLISILLLVGNPASAGKTAGGPTNPKDTDEIGTSGSAIRYSSTPTRDETTTDYTEPLPIVTVPVRWTSAEILDEELDSMAVARPSVTSGDEEVWLTAKPANKIHIFSARTGALIRTIGSKGRAVGQLNRPNGIAVLDGAMLVVERDNRRVQAFDTLHQDTVAGIFGSKELRYPYGIAYAPADKVTPGARTSWTVWITDDYALDKGTPAPSPKERIKVYLVDVTASTTGALTVTGTFLRTMGDPVGDGMLHKVESIVADPKDKLLYVCDETSQSVKIFNFDGTYTGRTIGTGIIRHDPEGVAIVPAPNRPNGRALLLADQHPNLTRFRLFDLNSGAHFFTFSPASGTANTDGLCFDPDGDNGQGVFYAVHDDKRLDSVAWKDVLTAVAARQ